MKVQPYVDKLEKSKEYKEFHKKYKGAFLTAGFFVLDFEEGKNIHQLDFYVPSEKKVAAFALDGEVKMQLLEMMNEKTPSKLDAGVKTDLDALHGILEDEMKNRNITEEIKKIVAVLQNIDGKKLWNLNCVLSGMEILRAHVDDDSQSVLKMEKFSMIDIMKKIPGNAMQAIAKGQKEKQARQAAMAGTEAQIKGISPKDLDKLAQEIEKEKKELEKEIAKEKAESKKVSGKKK